MPKPPSPARSRPGAAARPVLSDKKPAPAPAPALTDTFQAVLAVLVTQYGGNKQDLARAIQITPSRLSHLLTSADVPSTEVCLRLAEATGTNASKILRAAGKADVADLLEDLYGAAAERRQAFHGTALQLTPAEAAEVVTWRRLPARERRALRFLVAAITG